MNRDQVFSRALDHGPFDLLVIGGGASGLGVAWDASLRGFDVLLLEGEDFASGTSSRSTKLIHGGIRYLRQGHVSLVRESLREKSWLLAQAPSLVHSLRFSIPCRNRFEWMIYGAGSLFYSLLGGSSCGIPDRKELSRRFPELDASCFTCGVDYQDAQFDDARLALVLVREILANGGLALNYCRVEDLQEESGAGWRVSVRDRASNRQCRFRASMVVNATGVQADSIRRLAEPRLSSRIRASRGSHLVLRGRVLQAEGEALIIPRTEDGRVLFMIPWLGRTLIGTTDVEVSEAPIPPKASAEEIAYLLAHVNRYLDRPLGGEDIGSVFAGYRPLIDGPGRRESSELARDFEVEQTAPGLISLLGGKWTTFRAMAEAAVDRVIRLQGLPPLRCRTGEVELSEAASPAERDPDLSRPLGGFPYHWWQIRRAVREEMALTLEDVLARRTRCLFLDADESRRMAPQVAEFMASELGHPVSWVEDQLESFEAVAATYDIPS